MHMAHSNQQKGRGGDFERGITLACAHYDGAELGGIQRERGVLLPVLEEAQTCSALAIATFLPTSLWM